jgi:hypothetical protein
VHVNDGEARFVDAVADVGDEPVDALGRVAVLLFVTERTKSRM